MLGEGVIVVEEELVISELLFCATTLGLLLLCATTPAAPLATEEGIAEGLPDSRTAGLPMGLDEDAG